MKKTLTITAALLVTLYLAGPWFLTRLGEFLVVGADTVEKADAVVVLSTGVDYLPRLMQAAALYRRGLAGQVVINGNRKTDVHRRLDRQGYITPHKWYEGPVSVLDFLGVERSKIVTVSAEDAYDTVSEASIVGRTLKERNVRKIIITTSKFHTRRAAAIWRYLYPKQFDIRVVAAADDPFGVDGWWRSGRQIRQVLGEYGGWLYFWGMRLQLRA